MKMYIICIRDEKMECYGQPGFAHTLGVAIRDFENHLTRPDSEDRPNMLARHPGDYSLYALGKYDDETGQFEQDSVPQLLCRGNEVLAAHRKVSKT